MSYLIPRLSRKDAGICVYCTVGHEPSLYLYVILCAVQCVGYLHTKIVD
jgi:hypothetical protein